MDALTAVNVYVIEGGDGVVVIDAGWGIPEAEERLTEALAELGRAPGDVTEFLVTHAHRDHYTLAASWRQKWGCGVRVGLGEADYLATMRVDGTGGLVQVRHLARAGASHLIPEWLVWLDAQPRASDSWTEPSAWLHDGDEISVGDRVITAVATPGHTYGHFVFHDRQAGLLFSGDHVLPTITPSVGFQPVHHDGALRDFLASLQLVRDELPDALLLPAHGPADRRSHARVEELMEHHRDRLHRTLSSLGDGGSTAYEVADRLTWTRRETVLGAMLPYDAALAVMETQCHLELLLERGEVAAVMHDGVEVWRPV